MRHPACVRAARLVALSLLLVFGAGCAADAPPVTPSAAATPTAGLDSTPPASGLGGVAGGTLSPAAPAGSGIGQTAGPAVSPGDPASPGPSGSAPGSSTPPVPVGKALSHEVFGFVNWYSLPKVRGRIEHDALTTIGFFSVDADRDGHLVKQRRGKPTDEWKAWTSDAMTKLIEESHTNGTRVVLTISRFAWDAAGARETVPLLTKAAARKRLAGEVAAEVIRRGIDGVNVDLEPVPKGRHRDFTLLIREIRAALDAARPGLELTFASIGFSDEYDLPALLAPDAADAVFIMGYQYRGGFSDTAGSVAPMNNENFGVEQTIDEFLEGTTADRIILGVPYYGWQWPTASTALHARTLPDSPRNGKSGPVFYEEAANLADQVGVSYDEQEMSARVVYRRRICGGCPLVWRQLYFDDVKTLAERYAYVKERGLRGAGVWALGFEGARSAELYQVLREAFGTPQ